MKKVVGRLASRRQDTPPSSRLAVRKDTNYATDVGRLAAAVTQRDGPDVDDSSFPNCNKGEKYKNIIS